MIWEQPLVKGVLLKREKRFLAHCQLADGTNVVAHCANSGSMKGSAESGFPLWLEDKGQAPERKLQYSWKAVEVSGMRVIIDTHLANSLVAEALTAGEIAGLPRVFTREYKVGNSRLDFFFADSAPTYLEVKSVSMGEGDWASFPDAITERGQKHLRELMALKKTGARAVLLFLIMREGVQKFRVADEIDPEYGRLLREAKKAGVDILVYGTRWQGDEGVFVGPAGEWCE
jgi:sugar fermentation stimulation protein A